MKNINNYIFEKLKLNKNIELNENSIYIDLGKWLIKNTSLLRNYSTTIKKVINIYNAKSYLEEHSKVTYLFFSIQMFLGVYVKSKRSKKWPYSPEETDELIASLKKLENKKENKIDIIIEDIIKGFIEGIKELHKEKEFNIKESFEDNLFWKIDKYFERNEQEKKQFIDIVDYFRDHPGFNKKTVEDYLEQNEFEKLDKFIDFIDDIITPENKDRDYNYILYMVIKRIIENKNLEKKYTNKGEA